MEKKEKKVLTLNLKKQWYDMIESGEKREEYREIKDYWFKRLNEPTVEKMGNREVYNIKRFDQVKFIYGYTKRSMTFEITDITIREGKEEWGAVKGQRYFVISLGKRIG